MKILHTALRVFNLDRSIDIKNRILRCDGYIWDNTKNYSIGNGFSHIAIAVTDTIKFCDELKKQGIKITREPETTKGGNSIIAFIEDPDGYRIELLQRLF